MMGFGAYGNGGPSSSSSNLSALAPPFTVGRTVSNHSSNPPVNFINEPPPPPTTPQTYGVTDYNSSLHSWVPSMPAPIPDYYANFDTEVNTMPLPSLDNYGGPVQPLDAGAVGAAGAFTYGQYSNSVTTTTVDEVKPYYQSSYVSPTIQEKNPLVGLGDSTYDFLSACCLATTGGKSQDDYTKSFSSWGSTTRWDGSWNGSGDLESGKHTDSDWSFYSNKTNVAGPPIFQDYVKPGSGIFKGLSTSGEACADSHSIDVLGRENHMGSVSTHRLDGKSFIPSDFEFLPFQSATSGASKSETVSTSVSLGIQQQETTLESVINSLSSQKSYNAKYDNCSRQHDTCLDNFTSATKSTPALVFRPPAGRACSSQVNMKSSKAWNYNGTDVTGQNEDFSRKMLSSVNISHPTLSSEGKEICTNPSRFSIYLERNGQDAADTSSLSSNKYITKDAFNHLSKATELHVPQTSSSDRFSLVLDEAKICDSVENNSKSLDQYNPAEDSPCWKGATSSRFSPFEVSEAVASQHLTEKSESCGGSNLHGPQILPVLSNEAVKDISQKLSEIFVYNQNRSMENGSSPSINRPSPATYSFGEHMSNSKPGSFIPERSSDEDHFSNTVKASSKETTLLNNRKVDPDHRPSNTTKPLLQEVRMTSEKCASGTGFPVTEMNPNDASENGSSHVSIHTTEDVLSSLCGENALNKLTNLHGEKSTPKVDVPLLVNTMHNLSDLLLFYCSNDECALKEQDHVALKHVINNLNACMLKNPQLTLKRNSVFSSQDSSHVVGEPPAREGASVDRVHVTEIAAGNAMDQRVHEEKRHNILPGRKNENFWDSIPVHNDADIVKTDEMAQAIKKVFIENFHGKEEAQPQVIFYKNLWLEAEAVICSTNFRARFDRMKNEMEKCKSHEAKDVLENMMDVENLSKSKVYPDVITVNKLASSDTQSGIQGSPIINKTSHAADVMARFHLLKCRGDDSTSMNTLGAEKVSSSNVIPDLKEVDKLAPQASDSPVSEIYVEGSPISSKTNHADDVEDSVMARFRILKCRVDKTSSMDIGGQQLPGVDLGFVGKKEHIPDSRDGSKGGTFNITTEHDLQHLVDDCTEDKSSVNETSLCRNDTLIKSRGTDNLGNQHSPGWYDGSSLDLEHVMKDDFAWQN